MTPAFRMYAVTLAFDLVFMSLRDAYAEGRLTWEEYDSAQKAVKILRDSLEPLLEGGVEK